MKRLIDAPDTNHEDARGWYDNYGWHLHTEHGDVCLQAVEYDWLECDDDRVIELLRDGHPKVTLAEAADIVAKAREIRDTAESVEAELEAAVEAHKRGDLAAVEEALDDAARIESEHGATPATDELREKLIEEAEEEEAEDEGEEDPSNVTCSLCGEETPATTAHRHQDGWVGDECCWDERLRSTE